MKKRFAKVYIEISDICNLNCSFCHGTSRPLRRMSLEEFTHCLQEVSPYTDFVYFHLMGEPLLHPELAAFLDAAKKEKLKVILTTNGTLLPKRKEILLSAEALHKVNVSLHSLEVNAGEAALEDYLNGCTEFALAQKHPLVCFRLWNEGGDNRLNGEIIEKLHEKFPKPWVTERRGTRLADKVYLEKAEKFEWPDLSAEETGNTHFCYALRDQMGILSDGTVVPCCLDSEGTLALGNIFSTPLSEILESQRSVAIYNGFTQKSATEELCKKCGYAARFRK